ncbi:hypothetical protein M5689_011026 [Euphorbia peplus]|nr:hypothetical protein M5689_011026 [Euphorbia peplus]
MVARLMYLGDDKGNPPIICHVGDMTIPGSQGECIEDRGPSGVFNLDGFPISSKNVAGTKEEQDGNENDVAEEQGA